MIEFDIYTIPHSNQRYPTVGDYFITKNGLGHDVMRIKVSEMGNSDYEFLVALHELVEAYLVRKRGISEKSIDLFDQEFEKARETGLHPEDAEPGDDPKAPYYQEHQFASAIESLMAHELGVDWNEYDKAVMSL